MDFLPHHCVVRCPCHCFLRLLGGFRAPTPHYYIGTYIYYHTYIITFSIPSHPIHPLVSFIFSSSLPLPISSATVTWRDDNGDDWGLNWVKITSPKATTDANCVTPNTDDTQRITASTSHPISPSLSFAPSSSVSSNLFNTMSKAFNRVVTGWINSSPLTKKSDNGDNQQDSNEMQRGVKRKAKVDPYDPMGDEGSNSSLWWGYFLIPNARPVAILTRWTYW